MNPQRVGQLEIMANGDLVAVLHREPKMHPETHTFSGQFESVPYWTQMTPARARELAKALVDTAGFLDHCERRRSLPPCPVPLPT